jgi:L-alanine-DL-glutamate epimerase-like enolase superfamily enzyme
VVRIEHVETIVVEVPRRRLHAMASFAATAGRYVIVKVHTDNGVVGLGEATVVPQWGGDHMRYYGERPEEVVRLIADVLAPVLVGESPMRIGPLLVRLDKAVKGYPYAKAALDIALHDVKGRILGIPVYELLGGAYRDRVAIAQSLGYMEPAKAAAEAQAAIAEGIKTIKIKVGRDPSVDLTVVQAVRQAIGSGYDITIDANQGYPDPKTAIRAIRTMEQEGVRLAEQPVEGLRAMADVRAGVDAWVMADESAWTPQDVLEIVERKAADCISLYTTKPGGLHRAIQVAAVAQAAGMPCNVNGSGELGVGNAANLHLCAAAQAVTLPCVFPATAPAEKAPTRIAGRQYVDDIVADAFRYEDGYVYVPQGTGLGVELDDSKVARYRVA